MLGVKHPGTIWKGGYDEELWRPIQKMLAVLQNILRWLEILLAIKQNYIGI